MISQFDAVIQALIAEAAADPDVIGLVLTGSRAVGAATSESDYDVVFVVTDEALARYKETQTIPARGASITPPISTADIWHESPGSLQLDQVVAWMLPAYAEAQVCYDRTGETKRVLDAIRQIPAEQAQATIAGWYDAYLNGLYRSLKAWRWGNEFGGRMEAAQTADHLLHLLFALERHWRPYSSPPGSTISISSQARGGNRANCPIPFSTSSARVIRIGSRPLLDGWLLCCMPVALVMFMMGGTGKSIRCLPGTFHDNLYCSIQ